MPSVLLRISLAITGGIAMWAAFPPIAWGWAALIGVGCMTAAAVGARVRLAFLVGLLGGLAFFLPLLPWLQIVGTDAWLALSVFCALWFGLLGIGISWASRLPWWPLWVACLWVAQETLRGSVPFGGFPWGRLAFAQPDTPFGHTALWGGLAGTTFLVALVGAGLAAAILMRRRGWLIASLGVVLATWALPITSLPSTESAVVAAVQGGTPQTGMGAFDVRRAVLDAHVRETLLLAELVGEGRTSRPAFVLWPENASDLDPYKDREAGQAITSAARAIDVPILVGAVTDADDPSRVWNNGIVWSPESGPGERYIKTHPVPFGEYIPFRAELAGITDRFDRIPRDFAPGSTPGHLTLNGVKIGNVICFEVAYDDVMNALMQEPDKTTVITVQTNNATYNGTAQPAQQLEISRMRAMETGRTVIVAATSGISARIAPSGAVIETLDEGMTGVLIGEIALTSAAPLSATIGLWATWFLTLVGLLAALIGSRRRTEA
jgi:apolipoprotein N-acyltransferase